MEANELDLLNCMQDASTRYKMDENYAKARDALPDDHWFYSTLSPEYKEYLFEDTSFLVRMIARDMVDTNYPLRLGTMDELNEKGEKLVYMACHDASARFELEECDEVTKAWKTFRWRRPF